MKTNVLRFISTVLVLSICLTILPSFPAFAQEPFVQTVTPIDPEYISLQQLQTMVLPEEDRPEAVESYLVEQKGHVLRLREQEEDLNTVVFQNRDGNKTMYYFDQPVKYVDENGNIKDKKTTVTSVIDKAEYSADYGFVTSDNDIKTYFPKKLVGNKGILVEYQDVKIEVIPLSAEKNTALSAEKKQNQVDSQTRDSVEYNKAFGNNTLLKYTPTFGGFKEDIILASYAGKNEFSFKIKTNGLALVCEDGKYYLADPATEEKLMQVGDIVVYDSSMVPNTTPSVPVSNPVKPEAKELTEEEKNALYFPEGPLDPVYEHYYQLETVKEAEEYILTIVVDEDYLTCEDTVYPVTIDPSLTVVGSSFLDTTIYTNYSSAQGSSLNMFVGNHATRYGGTRGVARALIRFPGLFSNSTFASLSADDISHVDFMIRDTMCEGDGVWIDCYRLTQSWSELVATYSPSLWNGYVGFIDDEYVQYNGGTGSDGTGTGHWYHFNITNVVKEWLDGYYGGVSNHYGIMLKAFEETDPAKTFGTSENADYPPKVVVDYDDSSGGGDNGGGSTAVTSVQFSQDEYVVPVGWSGTFDVIVNPAGAVSGGFNWVLIGAHDIATIDLNTGVFTALAEGTKQLFVGAKNGGTGDSCTIRIVSETETEEDTAIIIIPGIMGSELFAGQQIDSYASGTRLWDPSYDIYAGDKISKLECNANGTSVYNIYAANENYGAQSSYSVLYNQLFTEYSNAYSVCYFPYDWRQSCADSAEALSAYIDDLDCDKVILVAHSMGGIVASHYLSLGSMQQQKVKKLITLGTPFLGATELINVYINGLDFGFLANLVVAPAIKSIVPNIKSVYELLPTQKWFELTDKKVFTYTKNYTVPGYSDDGYTDTCQTYLDTKNKLYYNLDAFNSSLVSLAEETHASLFVNGEHITSLVDSYYIVGTNEITTTNIVADVLGETGKPVTVDFQWSNSGDGTVPIWSADIGALYPTKTYYATNREHKGSYDFENSTIETEGLTVSENVIQLIKNIIDGNTYAVPTGITQTPPTYSSNGWTYGQNDEYAVVSYSENEHIEILNSKGDVIYSNSSESDIVNENIKITTINGIVHVTIYGCDVFEVYNKSNNSDVKIENFKVGELQSSSNITSSYRQLVSVNYNQQNDVQQSGITIERVLE